MSWSINVIGKPENVVAALRAESERLTDQSKAEFDAALPHIAALVEQNFAKTEHGYNTPLVSLEASGSGTTKNGDPVYGSTSVSLKSLYSKLV